MLHHWRRYCGHCKQESTPPLEQVLRLCKSLIEARAGAMYTITTLYTVTTKSSSDAGTTSTETPPRRQTRVKPQDQVEHVHQAGSTGTLLAQCHQPTYTSTATP